MLGEIPIIVVITEMKAIDWGLASKVANTRHQPSWTVQS